MTRTRQVLVSTSTPYLAAYRVVQPSSSAHPRPVDAHRSNFSFVPSKQGSIRTYLSICTEYSYSLGIASPARLGLFTRSLILSSLSTSGHARQQYQTLQVQIRVFQTTA